MSVRMYAKDLLDTKFMRFKCMLPRTTLLSTYHVHIHTRRPVVCINFIHSEHAHMYLLHTQGPRASKAPKALALPEFFRIESRGGPVYEALDRHLWKYFQRDFRGTFLLPPMWRHTDSFTQPKETQCILSSDFDSARLTFRWKGPKL